MSDERPSERVQAPEFRGHVFLYDDRVGMTAEELLDRAGVAFKELELELEVLHRQLPRKSERRLKRTSQNRNILVECLKGARARVQIARSATTNL